MQLNLSLADQSTAVDAAASTPVSARTECLIKGVGCQHSLGDCIQIGRVGALTPRRDRCGQLAIRAGNEEARPRSER